MFEFSLKSIQYMEKEIFFDEMTAREVTERLALIERLDRERREQIGIVNAITLTLARWSGCAPTDVVRLNAGATGVLIQPAIIPPAEVGVEVEPGEGGDGDELVPAKASAGKK